MRCFPSTANRPRILPATVALLLLVALAVPTESQSPASPQLTTLRAAVCNSQGQPLAGAAVYLQFQGKLQIPLAHTDAQGEYRFTALPPGAYTLRAEMAGYGNTSSGPFVLQAGQTKTIKLTLSPRAAPKDSSRSLPFFEEPQFAIAGVTDATSLGGHASNATAPAKDELAREVTTLGPPPSRSSTTRPAAKPPTSLAARDRAELYRSRADAEEKQGHFLEAVRQYERAAKLDPSEPNLFDWGAELLLHRATEPAIEVFSQGSRLYPNSVRTLLGLGTAWFVQGSYDQAARYLCQASDLDPANSHPYLFLGKIQEVETAPSPCIAQGLARFARLRPDDPRANYYYALSLWKRSKAEGSSGDQARVASLLEKATQLDPRFAAAYLQLGNLFAGQKRYPEAVSSYQKAIAASPRLADAHYRLAQVYMRTGEKLKARAEMQAYDQLLKANAHQIEREHRQIQQFVYTLRTPASSSPPR